MKKTIIFVLMLLGTVQVGAQQPDMTFKYDPELFLGKWEAKQGRNSYELVISKDVFEINKEIDFYTDLLLGEMIYKTDGEVVRHIKIDGHKAVFTVFNTGIKSPLIAEFSFNDKDWERDIEGTGEFVIDKNDPTKAKWTLGKRPKTGIIVHPEDEKPKKKDFDIPLNLQWRKVE